jgi:hypothetical protein
MYRWCLLLATNELTQHRGCDMYMKLEAFPGCCKKLILHTIGPVHGTPDMEEQDFYEALTRTIVCYYRGKTFKYFINNPGSGWINTWSSYISRTSSDISVTLVLSRWQRSGQQIGYIEKLGFTQSHLDDVGNSTHNVRLSDLITNLKRLLNKKPEDVLALCGKRIPYPSTFGRSADTPLYLVNFGVCSSHWSFMLAFEDVNDGSVITTSGILALRIGNRFFDQMNKVV